MICANFVPLIDTLPTVRILNTIHWITLVADLDMCRHVRNSNMLFKLPLREWDLCLKSDGTRHSGHCGATCKVLDLQTSITYDVVSRSRTLASILSTASFYGKTLRTQPPAHKNSISIKKPILQHSQVKKAPAMVKLVRGMEAVDRYLLALTHIYMAPPLTTIPIWSKCEIGIGSRSR